MTTREAKKDSLQIRSFTGSRRLRRHRAGLAVVQLALGLPVLALLLCATETEARAYADPGSGALIWQMLVAAFVGGAFYFRKFATWVKRRLESDTDQSIQKQEVGATAKDDLVP